MAPGVRGPLSKPAIDGETIARAWLEAGAYRSCFHCAGDVADWRIARCHTIGRCQRCNSVQHASARGEYSPSPAQIEIVAAAVRRCRPPELDSEEEEE